MSADGPENGRQVGLILVTVIHIDMPAERAATRGRRRPVRQGIDILIIGRFSLHLTVTWSAGRINRAARRS
ncbi:hypothetical protein [Micromonospora sp. NBS 11-29]|uniref:hypothetical protein n=1 Tax=Micromonospora sp. NBS 11-29 TaxID=1960879 RepID=UPI00111DFB20|nr:hypothetical protein [Micromonospora sp. NBS 11-29]